MKYTKFLKTELSAFTARVIMLFCAFVWSWVLLSKPDYAVAFILFLPFRLFILSPLKLYRYHSTFCAFSKIRLYFRAILMLIIRLFLYALILSPLALNLILPTLPKIALPFVIALSIFWCFMNALAYQRTFAVPVLLSMGETVFSAYKKSWYYTKDKIGKIALFYIKRFYFGIAKFLPPISVAVMPIFYKSKYKFTLSLFCVENTQDIEKGDDK